MGTDAHLVVIGGDALLDVGWDRIDELERRWSRFLPDSEITSLNRQSGIPVIVSEDTFTLVEHAVAAYKLTGGRFDPTVGTALTALGYDRDFSELAGAVATTRDPLPAPGLTGIHLDPTLPAVTLPAAASFDPGGIGKGLAADLVAGTLLQSGAAGALVNLGGDVRVVGEAPASEGWVISVPDPRHADRELIRFAFTDGAVATSSRLQRRWRTANGDAHHLVDPTTGRPARRDVVAVTVIADEGWRAEALTKDVFLAGPENLSEHGDVHAVVVTADGRRHATGQLESLLR